MARADGIAANACHQLPGVLLLDQVSSLVFLVPKNVVVTRNGWGVLLNQILQKLGWLTYFLSFGVALDPGQLLVVSAWTHSLLFVNCTSFVRHASRSLLRRTLVVKSGLSALEVRGLLDDLDPKLVQAVFLELLSLLHALTYARESFLRVRLVGARPYFISFRGRLPGEQLLLRMRDLCEGGAALLAWDLGLTPSLFTCFAKGSTVSFLLRSESIGTYLFAWAFLCAWWGA